MLLHSKTLDLSHVLLCYVACFHEFHPTLWHLATLILLRGSMMMMIMDKTSYNFLPEFDLRSLTNYVKIEGNIEEQSRTAFCRLRTTEVPKGAPMGRVTEVSGNMGGQHESDRGIGTFGRNLGLELLPVGNFLWNFSFELLLELSG